MVGRRRSKGIDLSRRNFLGSARNVEEGGSLTNFSDPGNPGG